MKTLYQRLKEEHKIELKKYANEFPMTVRELKKSLKKNKFISNITIEEYESIKGFLIHKSCGSPRLDIKRLLND